MFIMSNSLPFIRILFFVLSVVFVTVANREQPIFGALYGSVLGLALIGFDLLFKRFNLRSFNVAALGIIFGYFMGLGLNLVFSAIIGDHLDSRTLEMARITLFLFGIYLGMLMTIRSSDELSISIPFVRFTSQTQKKKDLLLDPTLFADGRIVDMAATGLLDQQLILPRFVIKELYSLPEAESKQALEVLKKLEATPDLYLHIHEADFPEKDTSTKMLRLARLLESNILTADVTKIQTVPIDGIRFVNLHSLSTALQPLIQTGKKLKVKIVRQGEPGQGIGYHQDGAMVVVNGAGDFLQQIVAATVIRTVPGKAGRIIFCNMAFEE
jgi:uncharacterized protein YacL